MLCLTVAFCLKQTNGSRSQACFALCYKNSARHTIGLNLERINEIRPWQTLEALASLELRLLFLPCWKSLSLSGFIFLFCLLLLYKFCLVLGYLVASKYSLSEARADRILLSKDTPKVP